MATKKRQYDKGALDDLLADLGGKADNDGEGTPARDARPAGRGKGVAGKPEPAAKDTRPANRAGKGTGGVDDKKAQAAAQPKPALAGRKLTGAQLRAEVEKTRTKLAVEDPGPAAGTPADLSGKESVPPSALVPNTHGEIHPKHHPKKHPPGSLKRGDSVWYRGERYWIEYAPSTWVKGCFARISSKPVHPDIARPSPTEAAMAGVKVDVVSFCVHPDLLDLAPQAKSIYAHQPTQADLARKERAKSGERDVGDEVAVKLRGAGSLDDVYRVGAEYLGVPEEELRAKYGHLNPGQQRMNIGNRMRAKWRKDNGHS